MKRLDWTTALAAAALAGLIAGAAAQTAEPAAPAVPAAPAAPTAPAAAAAPAPAEAAPAAAAPVKHAPKKAVRKKPAAKSASTLAVSVWNSRAADLTELQVAPSGSADFKKALGKLKAGKKTGARVPRTKDCLIDLHAAFADGETTEAEGVDVCKQKVLNLTD